MAGPVDIPRSKGEGIIFIILGIIFLLYSFYNPSQINPFSTIIALFLLAVGIFAIVYPWKKDPSTQLPLTLKEGGAFQLKAGEKMLKKYVGFGVILYLTDQRFVEEYFKFNLLTRTIEILLGEITNVERTSHHGRYGIEINTDVKVDFQHLGQPGAVVFGSGSSADADEWADQIRKAANLDAKKKPK